LANQQGGKNAGPPRQPPVVRLWAWGVAKIKRKLHERRAERKKEIPQDRFARRTANATVAIAVLTVVVAIVGGLQYCTFQGQLDVMQGELRPWVSANNIYISRPVIHDEAGLHVSLKFDLKNGGHSPALQTAAKFKIKIGSFNFLDEEKIQCAGHKGGLGNTIFADSSATQETSDLLAENEIVAVQKSGVMVIPIIISCVSYRFPERAKLYSSPYDMSLGPAAGNTKWRCCNFPMNEKVIEPHDLALTLFPISMAK